MFKKITLACSRYITNVLVNWHLGQRVLFAAGLISLEILMYLSWLLLVYFVPSLHHYVNLALILPLIIFCSVIFTCIFAIAVVFLLFEAVITKHKRIDFLLQLLLMLLHATFLGGISFLFGQSSLITGVAFVSLPILFLVLLRRKIAYIALFFCALLFYVVLLFQDELQFLPDYIKPSIILHLDLFWTVSFIYFCLPKVFVMFILTDTVLNIFKDNNQKLRYLSEHDALTGLLNRRRLHEYMQVAIGEHPQNSVILLDLDYFKHINDTYGHLMGDRVLVMVANLLKSVVRPTDLVGRFGGEEFLVFLPQTSQQLAKKVADRIHAGLQNILIKLANEGSLGLSASFGVAGSSDVITQQDTLVINNELSVDYHIYRLIEKADKALYYAKTHGRNQVVCVCALPKSVQENLQPSSIKLTTVKTAK